VSPLTPEAVKEALFHITDPEIGISIVDLGLIRKVDVSDDGTSVTVTMTLTTPFCPEGPEIVAAVEHTVRTIPGVTQGNVVLEWNPPWDPKTDASDEVKAELGIWE
jgi:metal-sulfur cluster biosynthetic enzyme